MEAAPDASRVEARIELTPADVLHGLQSMPERRVAAGMSYLMGAVALGVVGTMRGFDPVLLILFAFVGVLMLGMHSFSTRRLARRVFEDMPPDRREITYVFTPAAVEITTHHSHARNDYEVVKRYVITQHTLLLYVSGSVAQIIPLRAFEATDRERVLGWLKARVKPTPKVPVTLLRGLFLWAVLVVAFLLVWL